MSKLRTLVFRRRTFRATAMPRAFVALQNTWLPRFCSIKAMAKLRTGGPLAASSMKCFVASLRFTAKPKKSCSEISSTANLNSIFHFWVKMRETFALNCWTKIQWLVLDLDQLMPKRSWNILGSHASTGSIFNRSFNQHHISRNLMTSSAPNIFHKNSHRWNWRLRTCRAWRTLLSGRASRTKTRTATSLDKVQWTCKCTNKTCKAEAHWTTTTARSMSTTVTISDRAIPTRPQ